MELLQTGLTMVGQHASTIWPTSFIGLPLHYLGHMSCQYCLVSYNAYALGLGNQPTSEKSMLEFLAQILFYTINYNGNDNMESFDPREL